MAAKTGTYTLIASNTLGSAASSVTFNSIPGTYTDLVLVVNAKAQSSNLYPQVQINSTSNLSRTYMTGDGTSATSARSADNYLVGTNQIYSADFSFNSICHFMDYSNSTTYKTILVRSSNAGRAVEALVSTWRTTSAITSINYYASGNLDVGSTFKLYGIEAGNR